MASTTAFRDALILTGPTGSGKTALALELAERLPAEIIALDSMTLYRGLDIGTAKPTRKEQSRVRHHLIDVLDPQESASVAWWLDRAAVACEEIRSRGRVPLLVGGTPFYLKALLHGLFEAPAVDAAIREALEAEARTIGVEALHARLAAVDARTASRVHPNDTRRVVRALEIFTATGRPISELQSTWESATFENASPTMNTIPAVMLDWPRQVLVSRIEQRVQQMLAAGWLEECRGLLNQPLSKEALQAVGYQELFQHLRGELDLAAAVERIVIRTRQFAKRQLTWFRKLPVTPVAADTPELAVRVLTAWKAVCPERNLEAPAQDLQTIE